MKQVLFQRLLCVLEGLMTLVTLLKNLHQRMKDKYPMRCPTKKVHSHSLQTMDGISSTPVENSVQFLRLRDKYKSDLLDDSRLTKAAGLAAQQELLLERPAPDTWKEPRSKSVDRQLRQWTKKIRQPGGIRAIGRDDSEEDDDEYNLAVGPMQQFMSDIAKIQKGIKRKAVSNVLQTPATPAIKQSPVTPASCKKPKFSFKTGSKGKRLLPKTPHKTPLSAKGSVKRSPWTFCQSYKTPPK